MSGFSARYDPGVQVEGDGVLALHRNENLFVGDWWNVDTARGVVGRVGVSSYPDATSAPLRAALGELYGVGPERVFVGNGSDEVLADLMHLLRRRYDALNVLDVHFKVYPMLAERLDYRLVELPGDTFTSGRVDASGFRGLAVVDSPNGIAGSSVAREDLDALAADPESFLIWDNVYGEYAGDRMPVPLPENVAFVRSFSKFYALASLRVGYCIAGEDLVLDLLARKDAFNVNGFAQAMALEALRRKDEFEGLLGDLRECRSRFVSGLRDLGFEVRPPDSIAVLAAHPAHDAVHLQSELLARGIAVRRFEDAKVRRFIRMTVAPRDVVDRVLGALAEIV